jgi:hypothetical protein
MKHPDRTLARDAARYLAMRLPDPALDGTLPRRGPFNNEQEDPRRYLRDAGWRPELAADVRALAHAWLAAPEAELVTQAAFMIEAVGGAADAPVLSAALDRALERSLTLPFEAGGYPRPRGAMAELMRAAEVVIARGHAPTARPATPGEAALWLTAFGSGARPAGWEARLGELLEHRIPYIRELALKRLPADAPVDLFHAVESALQSADVDLQMAALDVVGRARLTAHRDAVAALVETVTDRMLRNAASNALHAIAGPLPPLEIAANRLVEPAQFNECVSTLIFGVLEARGAGGGPVSSEEAQNLSKRWKAFLAAHRSELEAGRRWAIDDPAVAGLIPSTWTVRPRAG